jgi:PTS system beta-glucosides-specific IIC component
MGKYEGMAQAVLKNVGGVSNIKLVERCATRVRIYYYDKSKVNLEDIKKAPNVVGVVPKTGQVQVIIGPEVNDAYNDFLDVSGWKSDGEHADVSISADDDEPRNFMWYLNFFGNKCAAVFMPIVPALITGGIILAIKNLMVNYMGFSTDSGTAQLFLTIFNAGFSFFPVWIGYTLSQTLKMEPIMGAFLGAVLYLCSGVEGLDFFGLQIPAVTYTSSVLPVVLGVALMYYVDKLLKKIIPDMVIYFFKPLLTMIIVVPVTLLWLGPLGTWLSTGVGVGITALMDTIGGIAIPILSVLYPYMVMLGLDKALTPIMAQSISTLGYDPFNMVMGLVSNLAVGASALAVAHATKDSKRKGMIASFGITALCGVTEPAFYGSLIMRPKALIGTAIGAAAGGLVAGLGSLHNFVVGGCPGLLTALFFVPADGSMGNFVVYLVTCAVTIVVSFVATRIIILRTGIVNE